MPGIRNQEFISGFHDPLAVSHLAGAFGRHAKTAPIITDDADVDSKMEISFISVGGQNFKTYDLITHKNNVFLKFGPGGKTIQAKASGKTVIQEESGFDYGIIIKINPSDSPKRTWICCAGIGSWGTSGAAWWLAHNWKKVYKEARGKPFAYITKTRVGSDDSTEHLHFFRSEQEVEAASQSVKLAR